jgi:hypothetical protein
MTSDDLITTKSLTPVLQFSIPPHGRNIVLEEITGANIAAEAMASGRQVSLQNDSFFVTAARPLYPGDISLRLRYELNGKQVDQTIDKSVTFLETFNEGFPVRDDVRYWEANNLCRVFRGQRTSKDRFLRCWTRAGDTTSLVFALPWRQRLHACFDVVPNSTQPNLIVGANQDLSMVLGDAGIESIKIKFRANGRYALPQGCQPVNYGEYCQLRVGRFTMFPGAKYRVGFGVEPDKLNIEVYAHKDGALSPLYVGSQPLEIVGSEELSYFNLQLLPQLDDEESAIENQMDLDQFLISFGAAPKCTGSGQ